jgi:hypothetical protein
LGLSWWKFGDFLLWSQALGYNNHPIVGKADGYPEWLIRFYKRWLK